MPKILNARSESAPPPKRVRLSYGVAEPDPHAALDPLGDKATRSATALAELAVQTSYMPETWPAQTAVAEAVCHEMCAATDRAWRHGIEHGKWLVSGRLEELTGLQAKLMDLQLRHYALEAQLAEARAALDRSSLRDISNVV